jgi:prophage maintenance system killer protein
LRFPTLEEAIACNEAVREPNEVSPSADDDDLERVERALLRAGEHSDPIAAAASLAYEVTFAQGFYEGNKRTAVLLARWFIAQNTDLNPDLLIPPDDHSLADLLVAAARGEHVADDLEALLSERAGSHG